MLIHYYLPHISEKPRLYDTPVGIVPSVTTILSADPAKIAMIQNWRKRVGARAADQHGRESRAHGTHVHANLERYLRGQDYESDATLVSLLPLLGQIREPLLIEGIVWHSLGYAGTCDLLCRTDRVELWDWKFRHLPLRTWAAWERWNEKKRGPRPPWLTYWKSQALQPRDSEWLQLQAYALAVQEVYDLTVDALRLVTISDLGVADRVRELPDEELEQAWNTQLFRYLYPSERKHHA